MKIQIEEENGKVTIVEIPDNCKITNISNKSAIIESLSTPKTIPFDVSDEIEIRTF